MRSGASGRPSCSWSSLRALARLLWSLARLSRCRVSSSFAFWVTVSWRVRLSPRCGTRIATALAPLLGEQLGVDVHLLGLVRHEHLLRHPEGRWLGVEVEQDAADELVRADVLHLVEHEALAADHPAPAHVEHLDGCLELVVGQPDHVEVLVAVGDHLLSLDRLADVGQPVAAPGGPLELQLVGRIPHRGLEPFDHRVGVALEELDELADQLVVALLVDLADARTGALLDVEQEARSAELLVALELGVGAGAHREGAQQQIEGLADRVRVGVGPEVADALAPSAAHHPRPGPLVVDRDREERVALVVDQPDVEARPVLLDEAVLEHERLDVVADLDPLDGLGGRHHLGGAGRQVRPEVVAQPAAQRLRLADVDHPAVGILELVGAGRIGDRAGRGSLHPSIVGCRARRAARSDHRSPTSSPAQRSTNGVARIPQ